MSHPYAELLKDRPVRILWAGLTLSSVGSELYRVGAIWLAATLAGSNASLLVAAQSAVMLAVSLLAGPAVEALPRRRFLVGAELVSAALSAAIVIVARSAGLTFPVLVAASVGLAAIGVMVRPVLLSSLPQLAPGHVREVNGLFDSTMRLAQAVGPFLAAAALKVLPAIHLLTLNAVSFLASAAAWAMVAGRVDQPTPATAARASLLRRLARGVTAANGCPGVWSVLVATGIRGGGYGLGYSVAVPLLFVRHGGEGLTKLALVVGLGAAAEVVSTPILVLTQPARPLRRLFAGYVTIGLSLAAMGLAAGLPDGWQLAGLCAAAVVMGVGNSTATLQITTFLATRLPGDDYAAVLRLRMVTIIGSMMLATSAGPLILEALGPAGTILICGLAGAAAGLAGMLGRPARQLGPGFEPA